MHTRTDTRTHAQNTQRLKHSLLVATRTNRCHDQLTQSHGHTIIAALYGTLHRMLAADGQHAAKGPEEASWA